jgi:hypothetical protein
LLPWDSPGQTAQFALQAIDLVPRRGAWLALHLGTRRAGQPPGGAAHDGCRHLQIA